MKYHELEEYLNFDFAPYNNQLSPQILLISENKLILELVLSHSQIPTDSFSS